MAKCLLKYQWVKLPRNCMPGGKGLLGYWLRYLRVLRRVLWLKMCLNGNAEQPNLYIEEI